ncbi:hypothetical protein ABE65_002480 [Fictibacillus phosphorivorans]|uniref:Uncharacterized protein n=1 Tax=Fictibacillus phosphorivorans TaxID=1221500 RepID=A0A160IJ06_9BACL|nr:hypothetical protein ABE65_002480 [Fictibacillus phosphorivorans]
MILIKLPPSSDNLYLYFVVNAENHARDIKETNVLGENNVRLRWKFKVFKMNPKVCCFNPQLLMPNPKVCSFNPKVFAIYPRVYMDRHFSTLFIHLTL